MKHAWMKRLLFAVLLTLLAGPSCSSGEEEPEVRKVYERLLEAVRASDGGALYEMSRTEFKNNMEELAGRLSVVQMGLDRHRSRLDTDVLGQGLYFDDLRFPIDGKELFRSLIDFTALDMGPSVEAGLAVNEFSAHGDYFSVMTRSGESFVFYGGEEGKWLSMLPEQAFELWENRPIFMKNLQKAEEALALIAKEAEELDGAKKP
jgi:hypothetical protein